MINVQKYRLLNAQVVSNPVSGAGPAREQPHVVLVPKSADTGDGPARHAGRPVRGHPAIGFETTCTREPLVASREPSLDVARDGPEHRQRAAKFGAIRPVYGFSPAGVIPGMDTNLNHTSQCDRSWKARL